ncbi:MAG: Rrf2 family transcriptional regulator [Rhodospirillaceae bacterium]|nr:Rrf2 family transcriptional regulator [Rhodospirillaceae bacterium]
MKPSTKAELALNGMVNLARHVPAKPISLAVLAEEQSISLSYLEQIFATLRRSGLVLSVRGPGGGYLLARPAGSISTGDIIDAIDEISAGNLRPTGKEQLSTSGRAQQFWLVMRLQILELFRQVTLQDILDGSFQRLEYPDESTSHAAE